MSKPCLAKTSLLTMSKISRRFFSCRLHHNSSLSANNETADLTPRQSVNSVGGTQHPLMECAKSSYFRCVAVKYIFHPTEVNVCV